ncbi:MAG: AI-2E family transporter [Desulfurobacteriaceae bacterium]
MHRYMPELYFVASLTVLLFMLFYLKPAIMPFFVASVLAYISFPIFNLFIRVTGEKKTLSALFTLFTIFAFIVIALFVILPTVVEQVQSFINYLPILANKLDAFLYKFVGKHFPEKFHFDFSSIGAFLGSLYSQIGTIPIGNFVSKVFSGFFSAVALLINAVLIPLLIYYFLVNAEKIYRLYIAVAPSSIQGELKLLVDKVHSSLSSYLLGQILVAFFVGFYIAVGLYFVGIKYSFLIGFVAGILNMIPYVGFFSGLIPSLLLAVFDNGELAAVVGVLVVFLSEAGIENLLYPVVMSHATGINPLLILFSIFVGGYLGGFLGIVISVPVAVMIVPVFESFLEKKGDPFAGGNNR